MIAVHRNGSHPDADGNHAILSRTTETQRNACANGVCDCETKNNTQQM